MSKKITVIIKQEGSIGALESHRTLRRKLQKEGHFKLIKQKEFFEKPSDKKRRKHKESIKEKKKIRRMQHE